VRATASAFWVLIAASRSISAKWARGRARAAISGSSMARIAASSSIRSGVSSQVATRPEDDSVSAPSATSRRTASRAGVIDTPNCLPMPRSVSGWPGASSPCITCWRRLRYSRSFAAALGWAAGGGHLHGATGNTRGPGRSSPAAARPEAVAVQVLPVVAQPGPLACQPGYSRETMAQ
jgi:hypothetical protein